MTVFLYLGGAAGVAGLLVSLAFATTRRRYGAVLVLGLALAAAWFAAVLLTAETAERVPTTQTARTAPTSGDGGGSRRSSSWSSA